MMGKHISGTFDTQARAEQKNYHALVLGAGVMGQRHIASLIEIAEKVLAPRGIHLDISAVDRRDDMRSALPPGVKSYADIDSALAARKPDIAVMAFNDDQHISAFRKLFAVCPDLQAVLTPAKNHVVTTGATENEVLAWAASLEGHSTHPLAAQKSITAAELKSETMLLLGNGHCFRDHVLEVCPEFARFSSAAEGIRKSFEGSSLETIKHMVASGMGVTVVPCLSVPAQPPAHLRYIPFEGTPPSRRVVLAWRRTFTRYEAIAALRNAIYACPLEGVTRLS